MCILHNDMYESEKELTQCTCHNVWKQKPFMQPNVCHKSVLKSENVFIYTAYMSKTALK